MTPIIEVKSISKKYQLGSSIVHDTLRDLLVAGFKVLLRKRAENIAEKESVLWALKNISFEVQRGEVLGIIGRNGAGKSTLLKILSRITDPTEGEIRVRGRVGSLLEVGTGFHPELTGRENIFLNGSMLGMKKTEISKKFDEIVAFSEIEKFLDTPVKRYSSGMYVRLAFAVAAYLEPEILIVDEVLAVGDVQFQKKCLGKIGEVAHEGRTVVFVSHNMGAIHTLTQKCLYLDNGEILFFGDTNVAVEKYLTGSLAQPKQTRFALDYYRPDYIMKVTPDERKVYITDVWVANGDERTSSLEMGDPFAIFVSMQVTGDIQGANLSMILANSEGYFVTTFFSWDQNFYLDLKPGKHVVKLTVQGMMLTPGKYFINAGINQSAETTAWDVITNVPLFEARNTGQVIHWLNRPWGVIHWNNVEWKQE